jgi:hypothetical protein
LSNEWKFHKRIFGIWQTTGRCLVWKMKDQAATRRKRKDKEEKYIDKKRRINK